MSALAHEPHRHLRRVLHWLTAIFAVVGAFFTCGVVLSIGLHAVVGAKVAICMTGFVTASAVIGIAYSTAPCGRVGFALLCLLLGAFPALALVGPTGWLHPDFDPSSGGSADLVPFAWTFAGGLLAFVACVAAKAGAEDEAGE